MFENMTFELILEKMLEKVDDKFDKREGSIIYDALAPASVELTRAYIEMDTILNESFADTASREFLIRRASERGLSPYPATHAEIIAELTGDFTLKHGDRFNLDKLNYVYEGDTFKDNKNYYILKCESAGIIGNVDNGKLIPIENITGLEKAEVIDIFLYGEDEEDTEQFRQRYFDSINDLAFGGNIADYKQKVKAMDGVGGVRVYRADDWRGAGTVKIAITTAENTAPTEELINAVKEALDPTDYEGKGKGLAPIGHIVTVVGAERYNIDINVDIDINAGNNITYIENSVKEAINNYITDVNEIWEKTNSCIYISGIIAAVKAINGIIDVYNVTINNNKENLKINNDDIAVLNSININIREV